jgi:hypothetical protein
MICKQLVNRPTNALFVEDVHGKTNDYGLPHLISLIIKMFAGANLYLLMVSLQVSDPVLYNGR